MLIYIVCLDILFIHFPASTHGVVVATGSPLMMVTVQFLQMGELFPEHPVTYTLEDMMPGPSPLISTASEPAASASYHPSAFLPLPSPLPPPLIIHPVDPFIGPVLLIQTLCQFDLLIQQETVISNVNPHRCGLHPAAKHRSRCRNTR